MYIYLPIIIIVILLIIVLAGYATLQNSRIFKLLSKLRDLMHQKAEVTNFLNHFSRSLKSLEDIDDSMATTARYIADMIEAESICIYNCIDGKNLNAMCISGAYPLVHGGNAYIMTKPKYILDVLRRESIVVNEGLIGTIVGRHEPFILEDASGHPALEEFGTNAESVRSLIIVPLVRDAILTGAICAVNSRTGEAFTAEQYNRLRSISPQVILTQNVVKAYNNLSEQQRISQELKFARRLQASLIPRKFPDWGHFKIEAIMQPAKEVSGDFYDFVEIDEDRLLVVIGDACGKGVPACMLMAMTRSFIHSIVGHFTTVEDMMHELNRNLFRDSDEDLFVTMACCLIDKRNSLIEYCRAGHTEFISFVRDHLRIIDPEGTALGILPEEFARFDSICMEFEPGVSYLLFTDGITEALNVNNNEYGVEKLQNIFKEASKKHSDSQKVIDMILEDVAKFETDPENISDDQTLVLISSTASDSIDDNFAIKDKN
ncbi:MAG: SpoIIE family protein phosphatase [Victivallaceae bacterium]|nr:SpoIIE family protein phosphatase [Victivallaceae bacterium]NLK83468.1 SpoIIE family protein phosphatase [Lentisphaerota bacterium]MDD3117131.1 SpoIIE family protein phosphatase [Victivallaceae bacterium]MDD3702804.1 SpoIIE family protein phosphatase [Victivallaceae bacterium]MDD4317749.1 SpoIIE family protein phosphatase [Victivallaceae bacterium]